MSRRVALLALVPLPLLGGGWLWLRDSSLVAVQQVRVSGASGPEGAQIRAALRSAARTMTTMDLNAGVLRAAVARYPVVADVRARTSFPHGVAIEVLERPPVAVLQGAGERTAVAADGTALGPSLVSSALPAIEGHVAPATGRRLNEQAPLAAVTALGAAPPALLRFVARAYEGPEGLTLAMRNGLLVYFGDALRPHAKWLSLARVLASPDASGAVYVDVRLPGRPAAGFTLPSSSPAVAAATQTPGRQSQQVPAGGLDPTAAAIAQSLENTVGTSAATGAGASESGSPASSGASEEASSSGSSGSEGSSSSGGVGSEEAASSPPSG